MAGVQFKMFKETQILEKQAKILLMGKWLLRSKHSNEGLKCQAYGLTSSNSYSQKSPDYPATKQLPLPSNIKELTAENFKFSPQRSRDISGSFISSATAPSLGDQKSNAEAPADDRIDCYDCSGTVSLSSVMQTNVPFPFVSRGKPVHLNMPGGQWGQKEKYVSEDLNNAHHKNADQSCTKTGASFLLVRKTGTKNLCMSYPVMDPVFSNSISSVFSVHANQFREYCTEKSKVDITTALDEKNSTSSVSKLTNKEKLKAAVKDYGVVVVLFHVSISLVSLGCCYLIIARVQCPGEAKRGRKTGRRWQRLGVRGEKGLKDGSGDDALGRILPNLPGRPKVAGGRSSGLQDSVALWPSDPKVNGIDLPDILKNYGADEGALTAGNAARFIIAYALHKSLAPGRIAITLAAVPFIVRKLRKIGLLKTPQSKHH